MSLFVEVNDVEKGCQVIINLESVMEIAPKVKRVNGGPLMDDGCDIFFPDAASVGGKRAMKVSDSYSIFRQFIIQSVSAEDVARVNGRIAVGKKEKAPVILNDVEIPKL